MAIRMLCPSGHELVMEDQDAGREIRCPQCKLLVVVPNPQAASTSQPSSPRSRPDTPADEIDLSHFEVEDLPPLEAVDGADAAEKARPGKKKK